MKFLEKICTLISLFLVLITQCFSQNQAIITLDDNQSNQPAIYEARDMVKYKPGYHFSGQNGTIGDDIREWKEYKIIKE